MSAHDRRVPGERCFWLVPIPDEAVARDRHGAEKGRPVSLGAVSLPAMQRPGDLVIGYGATTGIVLGEGEIAGAPLRKEDEHGLWRVRVTPRLILDPDSAPSLAKLGIAPPGRPRLLEPPDYERVRELMLSYGSELKDGGAS
jgi:hypothetical protein